MRCFLTGGKFGIEPIIVSLWGRLMGFPPARELSLFVYVRVTS